MKQIVLWMARIFAMLLVFTMGASTQSVNAQDDGYAGFWGDMSNIYGHKVWNLVPVDEESLKNPVEITEIDGNTEDGYYYINFKDLDDPSTCMVPVNSDQLWRLGAFPREESDFDASFVWHITKKCRRRNLLYQELRRTGTHIHRNRRQRRQRKSLCSYDRFESCQLQVQIHERR